VERVLKNQAEPLLQSFEARGGQADTSSNVVRGVAGNNQSINQSIFKPKFVQ
jgi:hypothetical protein